MDIKVLKSEVDNYLDNYFNKKIIHKTDNKIIYEAMSYSINNGGKRIRPILCLLSYRLFKDNYKDIMPIAGAIEMIHTYSLIHDDLPCMDDDDLRRGKPTSHKVFGEAIAVLAGDALLNESFNIMFEYCKGENKNAIKACSVISNASGADGMIGGQLVDVLCEGEIITENKLKYMYENKTGALIKASIISGAILGNANKNELDIISKYGDKLGIAFQIKDDILDVIGDTNLLGKKVKSDENNNKSNSVTYFGLEKSMKICDEITSECIQFLDDLEHLNTSELKELTMFLLERKY